MRRETAGTGMSFNAAHGSGMWLDLGRSLDYTCTTSTNLMMHGQAAVPKELRVVRPKALTISEALKAKCGGDPRPLNDTHIVCMPARCFGGPGWGFVGQEPPILGPLPGW